MVRYLIILSEMMVQVINGVSANIDHIEITFEIVFDALAMPEVACWVQFGYLHFLAVMVGCLLRSACGIDLVVLALFVCQRVQVLLKLAWAYLRLSLYHSCLDWMCLIHLLCLINENSA